MSLRKRGRARRRYNARQTRSGAFRSLIGWFILGMFSALIFVVIMTPLTIRYIMPVTWLDRLPPVLKCMHPSFCRDELLPTVAAPVDVESLFEVAPPGEAGDTAGGEASGGGEGDNPGAGVAMAAEVTDTPAWSVSTTEPTPTLMPTATPDEAADPVTPTASALDFNPATPTEVIPLTPTPAPTETPVAVAEAAQAEAPIPPASHLIGFKHITQSWNNCGPATLTMGLNYWGWGGSQADAARWLKPDANDKNVTPEQMVEFVNRELSGLKAVARHAGNIALLKRLIVAGYPVVVETGFAPDGYDWMGHYRLVIGYSDAEGSFYVYDSFLGDGGGQGRVMTYNELDKLWQEFNRVYVVVYPEAQETHVAGVLGDDWDPELNAQHALRTAQIEAQMDRGNPFAWFNLGTSFVLNGQFEEASRAYDEARNLGLPWRMLWYQFGPFEAYLNTNRLDDVLALALANDNNTKEVEETYYYWGLALAQRGQYAEAGQKFRQATTINRNFEPAYQAIQALPQ